MTHGIYGTTDLSSKEWAVVALVTEGFKNKEVAEQLGTTEHVIKNYLRVIYDKTGSWNRTELALWYLRIGISKEQRMKDRRENHCEVENEQRTWERRKPVPKGRVDESK